VFMKTSGHGWSVESRIGVGRRWAYGRACGWERERSTGNGYEGQRAKPRRHCRSLSRRSKTNSTRRFCVRPARVSFAAMKQQAPRALTLSVGVSVGGC
jgi:hypothetical protein